MPLKPSFRTAINKSCAHHRKALQSINSSSHTSVHTQLIQPRHIRPHSMCLTDPAETQVQQLLCSSLISRFNLNSFCFYPWTRFHLTHKKDKKKYNRVKETKTGRSNREVNTRIKNEEHVFLFIFDSQQLWHTFTNQEHLRLPNPTQKNLFVMN